MTFSDDKDDKGWYAGANLPHFERAGLIQAITFRLADALPEIVLKRWAEGLAPLSENEFRTERELRIAAWLDAGHGACHLKNPAFAKIVEDALLHFDGERYRLLAWRVMPNHVHVLVKIFPAHPFFEIVQSWKKFTALKINEALGATGAFWMRDNHDRYIRNVRHLLWAIRYIEENPVKAKFCAKPQDWRWSSARRNFDRQALVEEIINGPMKSGSASGGDDLRSSTGDP